MVEVGGDILWAQRTNHVGGSESVKKNVLDKRGSTSEGSSAL
jgi:hypothetical protein